MDEITFYTPEEYIKMLKDIKGVPFAKTDNGYQFAYWIYDLNDTDENYADLLTSNHGEEAVKLLDEAKEKLKELVITEDDYLQWSVYKKEADTIKQYHKIIHDLSIALIMLVIDERPEKIKGMSHESSDVFRVNEKKEQNSGNKRKILNRHNPFADVTIKSQQFYYKTESGETETLFFSTNNIVEKVEKNGRSILTMHPGFTVAKEHDVVRQPMQKITFSNSITEPIIDNDDHIYVHID